MVLRVPNYSVLPFQLAPGSKFVRHLYARKHRDNKNDEGDDCTLFVANVPAGATLEALEETFSKYGDVKDIVLGGLTKDGAKHVAHVVFEDAR